MGLPTGTSSSVQEHEGANAQGHDEGGRSVLDRLDRSARAAHDHHVAYVAEKERRDSLIVDAFDAELAVNRIAHAAGLSHGRCIRILAARD